ncbi:hypothetical protein ACJX0J_006319 [Zea mays]
MHGYRSRGKNLLALDPVNAWTQSLVNIFTAVISIILQSSLVIIILAVKKCLLLPTKRSPYSSLIHPFYVQYYHYILPKIHMNSHVDDTSYNNKIYRRCKMIVSQE